MRLHWLKGTRAFGPCVCVCMAIGHASAAHRRLVYADRPFNHCTYLSSHVAVMRSLLALSCGVFVSRRRQKRTAHGLPIGAYDPDTHSPAWILMLDGQAAAAPLVSIQQSE